MHNAIELSKYIIHKCITDSTPITNLELQRILYYIQKEFLTTRNEPAFLDSIEAWQFGPVVPSVYYFFTGNGTMPISLLFLSFQPIYDSTIDTIVNNKRTIPPWTLVADTHKQGSAWSNIYNNGLGYKDIIPMELIKLAGYYNFDFL